MGTAGLGDAVTRLLLFDIDGTLLHCGGIGLRSLLRAAARRAGVPECAWSGLALDGMTDPLLAAEAIRSACGREPRDEAEIAELLAEYELELQLGLTEDRGLDYVVFPGVVTLLESLAGRADCLVGLGTGNTERGAQAKLRRGGLDGYFQFGGYGSDAAARATVLAQARQRGEALLGRPVPASDVVVIGDTARDVHAALANGFRMVGIANGRTTSAELLQAGAHRALDDFTDPPGSLAAVMHWPQR